MIELRDPPATDRPRLLHGASRFQKIVRFAQQTDARQVRHEGAQDGLGHANAQDLPGRDSLGESGQKKPLLLKALHEGGQNGAGCRGVAVQQRPFQPDAVQLPFGPRNGTGGAGHAGLTDSPFQCPDRHRGVQAGIDGGVKQVVLDGAPPIVLDQGIVRTQRRRHRILVNGIEQFEKRLLACPRTAQPGVQVGLPVLADGRMPGRDLPELGDGREELQPGHQPLRLGLKLKFLLKRPLVRHRALLIIVGAVVVGDPGIGGIIKPFLFF